METKGRDNRDRRRRRRGWRRKIGYRRTFCKK
jgi:hypothetical protein